MKEKLQELLLNINGKYGKFCFCANSTEDMNDLIGQILALFQPPAEGEPVDPEAYAEELHNG